MYAPHHENRKLIIFDVNRVITNRVIKRKEIIGNRYNNQQLPFQTPKGKKDALKVTAPQSTTKNQKNKRRVSSPKMARRLSKMKISPRHTCKDIR